MEVDTTMSGNLICNWTPQLVVNVWISHTPRYYEWSLLQLRLKNDNKGDTQKQKLHPRSSPYMILQLYYLLTYFYYFGKLSREIKVAMTFWKAWKLFNKKDQITLYLLKLLFRNHCLLMTIDSKLLYRALLFRNDGNQNEPSAWNKQQNKTCNIMFFFF